MVQVPMVSGGQRWRVKEKNTVWNLARFCWSMSPAQGVRLGTWAPIQLGMAGTDHRRWAGWPLAGVLIQTWSEVETPGPSLDNRWFKEMSGRRQH